MARDKPKAPTPAKAGQADPLAVGKRHLREGDLPQAERAFRDVLARASRPELRAAALGSLGEVFISRNQSRKAEGFLRQSIEIDPRRADTHFHLATSLKRLRRYAEAIAAAKRALALKPDDGRAVVALYDLMRAVCAWQELPDIERRLEAQTARSIEQGRQPAEPALLHVTRCDDPARNLVVARLWAAQFAANAKPPATGPVRPARPRPKDRLVLGYLSSDLHDHATAHLIGDLFALHDRAGFRVNVYSYGIQSEAHYRNRAVKQADLFVDLRDASRLESARRIAADGVDILIDLKGQTWGTRLEICAYRPAPVQIAWLGFPGTSGAAFFDYVVTDRIVTPPAQQPHYTERFIYMPHCYQINDGGQEIAPEPPARADHGIPPDAFVFGSFNRPNKIEPGIFAAWMRILAAVPDGALVLYSDNEAATANLRAAAARAGMAPERLCIAKPLPNAQHLARMRLADLVLDTRLYNGHTTTSDALRAGVPVVAIEGRHFASRVSASLLQTVGLPELVAPDVDAYCDLAVALARDPQLLAGLRARLAANRAAGPLFDTRRFARDLERGYRAAWDIACAGAPPRPIEL